MNNLASKFCETLRNEKRSGSMELEMPREEGIAGEEIPVSVHIQARDGLKVKKIVFRLKEFEISRISTECLAITSEETTAPGEKPAAVRKVYEEESVIHGEMNLTKGEKRTITGEFVIPADAKPTFVGETVSHEWTFEAHVKVIDGEDLREKRKFTVLSKNRVQSSAGYMESYTGKEISRESVREEIRATAEEIIEENPEEKLRSSEREASGKNWPELIV